MIQVALPAGYSTELLSAACAEELAAALCANRTFLTRIGDFEEEVSLTASDWRLRLSGVVERVTGVRYGSKLAGAVSLLRYRAGVFGIGYWIAERHAGKGVTSAAVALVSEAAFAKLGADEVWAGVSHKNVASQRVLTKCGFLQVRVQPSHLSYLRERA